MGLANNVIHENFIYGKNFEIGYNCIIHEDCEIGDNVTIKDFVRLGKGTKIGDNTVIDSYVRSSGGNKIGDSCTIRYGATIAREVTIEDGVFISPNVMTIYLNPKKKKTGGIVIGKNSFIGTNVVLGAGVQIGSKVVIGTLSWIQHCIIEDECFIHGNVVIGSQGLNVKRDVTGVINRVKAKNQVYLERKVNVGASSIIHRGVEKDTVIGEGTVIGPKCNIGHDTYIGKHCIIINGSMIAGNVTIGDYSRISSATIKNRIKVGHHATVGIGSLVMHDVPDFTTVVGRPAKPIGEFRKDREKLDELLRG